MREAMKMRNVLCSIGAALFCTILSYFNGGVRYDYGDAHFAPIWIQLVFNFVVFFAVFMIAICTTKAIVRKLKNKQ